MKERPEIPEEKIIEVKNDTRKIDFAKPFKFIYFDFWYDLLVFPVFLLAITLLVGASLFFSLRLEGRKNLKILRKRGCIVVSNHCHYFDTVFASYRLFPRKLFITVVQRNYEVPVIRYILRIFRALPIPANPAGFKMITKPIGEALGRGHHVMFLPEGELVFLSQTIYRFRPGAFYQAYIHQAPVLPMVYVIKRRTFRGREMGPAWVKMTQVIGEPVYPPSLTTDGEFPKKALDDMAETVASWMERTIQEHSVCSEKHITSASCSPVQ